MKSLSGWPKVKFQGVCVFWMSQTTVQYIHKAASAFPHPHRGSTTLGNDDSHSQDLPPLLHGAGQEAGRRASVLPQN